jgi:hypothetical protein
MRIPKPTRSEVYAVIDGERWYQDTKHGVDPHTLTEWMVFIEDYSRESLHATAREPSQTANPKILINLRKIAAMCVAAMEQHGAETRVTPAAR